MKRFSHLNCLLAVFSLLLIISCQKEVKTDIPGTGGGTGSSVNPGPVQRTVTGKVVDNNNNLSATFRVRRYQ